MQFFKTFNTVLLAGALMLPVISLAAQSEERSSTTTTTTTTQRYYDQGYKQYHEWTPSEDRAYHHYMEEQHREYREFPKTTVQEQTEYWKWRHDHPDKVIQKSETTTEEHHEQ